LKPDGLATEVARPAIQAIPDRSLMESWMGLSCEITRPWTRAFPSLHAHVRRRTSHDWHVQPVVKDRIRIRLSGACSVEVAVARGNGLSSKLAVSC